LTVLEVSIAMTIVASVLVATVGAFGTSLSAVDDAERRNRAAIFLQTVMEDLSAQTFDGLPAFNGSQVFDESTLVASNFTVDLSVFTPSVDLLQVDAVLTDRRTGREAGRVTTLRSRR
jgi:hypothetical protein